MSLQHVSTLKGPYSGSIIDTFQQQGQQNESPDGKFKSLYILLYQLAQLLLCTWCFNVKQRDKRVIKPTYLLLHIHTDEINFRSVRVAKKCTYCLRHFRLFVRLFSIISSAPIGRISVNFYENLYSKFKFV